MYIVHGGKSYGVAITRHPQQHASPKEGHRLLSVDISENTWNQLQDYIMRWHHILTHAAFIAPSRYEFAALAPIVSHRGL